MRKFFVPEYKTGPIGLKISLRYRSVRDKTIQFNE